MAQLVLLPDLPALAPLEVASSVQASPITQAHPTTLAVIRHLAAAHPLRGRLLRGLHPLALTLRQALPRIVVRIPRGQTPSVRALRGRTILSVKKTHVVTTIQIVTIAITQIATIAIRTTILAEQAIIREAMAEGHIQVAQAEELHRTAVVAEAIVEVEAVADNT